jgi:hypothetical protein
MSSSFTSTNVQPKPHGTIGNLYLTVGAGIYEEKEEIGGSIKKQAARKKRGRPTNETTKKTKKFVVKVGNSDDEEEVWVESNRGSSFNCHLQQNG